MKSEEREELNRLREYAFSISDNGQEVSESSSVPEAINEDVIRDAGEIFWVVIRLYAEKS